MAIHYTEPLDRTFHARGDGTRRQVIAMLAIKGACSASEMQQPFDVAQPTISKHLKVLETAGIVTREVEGGCIDFVWMSDQWMRPPIGLGGTRPSGRAR